MRIEIFIESNPEFTKKDIRFFIEDFPNRPQKDDHINLAYMIDGISLSKGEEAQIHSGSFSVDFVVWSKDEKGFYLTVWLKDAS